MMASTEAPPAEGWVYGVGWELTETPRVAYSAPEPTAGEIDYLQSLPADEAALAAPQLIQARPHCLRKPVVVGRDHVLKVKWASPGAKPGQRVTWECWHNGEALSGRGIVNNSQGLYLFSSGCYVTEIAVDGEPTPRAEPTWPADGPVRVRPLSPEEQP